MAMTGGTAYLVKSEKTNYGKNSWTVDLYVYVKIISQDTSNNTSTLKLGMYVYRPYNIAWGHSGSLLTIGGYSGNGYISQYVGYGSAGDVSGAGTTWLIENEDITVAHLSDGTCTVPICWSWDVSSQWGQYVNPSGTLNVTLPTIPRKSTISANTFTMGNEGTINISRASSSFTHTITYAWGDTSSTGLANGKGYSGTICTKTTATSVSWTPPIDFAKIIPNDTAGQGALECKTYNGSTLVGTTSITFIANVPSNFKPSIGNFTSYLDSYDCNGRIVQDKTVCRFDITDVAAGYGCNSTVLWSISGPNFSDSGTIFTDENNNVTNIYIKPTQSGTLTYTVTVTDSRGRTASKTTSFYVYPYGQPSSVVTATRTATSGDIKISFRAFYSPVDGQNEIKEVRFYSKTTLDDSWSLKRKYYNSDRELDDGGPIYTTSKFSGSDTYILKNCSPSNEYQIFISVRDKITNSSYINSNIISVSTEGRPLNISSNGRSVAIGKLASTVTDDANENFEVGWNTTFDKNVTITGKLTCGVKKNIIYDANDGRGPLTVGTSFHLGSTNIHDFSYVTCLVESDGIVLGSFVDEDVDELHCSAIVTKTDGTNLIYGAHFTIDSGWLELAACGRTNLNNLRVVKIVGWY